MKSTLAILAVCVAALTGAAIVNVPSRASSGPPTVPVEVVNTEGYPVPVRSVEDPGAPFQIEGSLRLGDGESVGTEVLYTVPLGKRFAIEFVSMRVTLPQDQELRRADLRTDATESYFDFSMQNSGNNGFAQWGFSRVAPLSASNEVKFTLGRGGVAGAPPGAVTARISLSGRLIDAE